jgi:hypothetical protein
MFLVYTLPQGNTIDNISFVQNKHDAKWRSNPSFVHSPDQGIDTIRKIIPARLSRIIPQVVTLLAVYYLGNCHFMQIKSIINQAGCPIFFTDRLERII